MTNVQKKNKVGMKVQREQICHISPNSIHIKQLSSCFVSPLTAAQRPVKPGNWFQLGRLVFEAGKPRLVPSRCRTGSVIGRPHTGVGRAAAAGSADAGRLPDSLGEEVNATTQTAAAAAAAATVAAFARWQVLITQPACSERPAFDVI